MSIYHLIIHWWLYASCWSMLSFKVSWISWWFPRPWRSLTSLTSGAPQCDRRCQECSWRIPGVSLPSPRPATSVRTPLWSSYESMEISWRYPWFRYDLDMIHIDLSPLSMIQCMIKLHLHQFSTINMHSPLKYGCETLCLLMVFSVFSQPALDKDRISTTAFLNSASASLDTMVKLCFDVPCGTVISTDWDTNVTNQNSAPIW